MSWLRSIVNEPFFWTTFTLFGLVCSTALVSGALKPRRFFGLLFPGMFIAGRIIIPLVDQNTVDAGRGGWIVGIGLVIAGLGIEYFPCLKSYSEFLVAPNKRFELRTTGLYAITRNPVYLGEVIWSIGWSLMFGSIIGLLFVPVAWIGLLLHIAVEESSMERVYGDEYLEYKNNVRGRIIPGLPF